MTDSEYVQWLRRIRAHADLELSAIRDAGRHGADSGFAGFTYTVDGAEFTRAHREDVWRMLAEDANEYGSGNVAEFVAGFGRADMTDTADGFDCLLAWYVLETVGRRALDRLADRGVRS